MLLANLFTGLQQLATWLNRGGRSLEPTDAAAVTSMEPARYATPGAVQILNFHKIELTTILIHTQTHTYI